jgi:hypothetical protein
MNSFSNIIGEVTLPVIMSGLTAYFDFKVTGETITEYYGSCTGSTNAAYTAGKKNSAIRFTSGATMNIATIHDADNIKFTGDFSVSFWCYSEAISGNSLMIQKGLSPYNYAFDITAIGKFGFRNGIDGVQDICYALGIIAEIDKWYHVVGTFSTVTGKKFYINAIERNSDPNIGELSVTVSNLYLGCYSQAITYQFEGLLDEIAMYNRVLSPDEIKYIYQGGAGRFMLSERETPEIFIQPEPEPEPTPYDTGLIHYFRFENDMVDVFDTLTGTATNVGYGIGKNNVCASVSGSSSYVSTQNVGLGLSGSFSFWLRPSATGNLQIISNCIDFQLFGNTIYWCTIGSGVWCSDTDTFGTDVWKHVVLTFDNLERKLYVDGTLKRNVNSNVNNGTNSTLCLFQTGWGGYKYSGAMDELAIWNRSITVDEVTQLYNSGTGIYY